MNTLNKEIIKPNNLLKRTDLILKSTETSQIKHSCETIQIIEVTKELKKIIEIMFETLADKIVANKSQRKVNKLLINKINDLESQLKLKNVNKIEIHESDLFNNQ
jgi:hypothetical protein